MKFLVKQRLWNKYIIQITQLKSVFFLHHSLNVIKFLYFPKCSFFHCQPVKIGLLNITRDYSVNGFMLKPFQNYQFTGLEPHGWVPWLFLLPWRSPIGLISKDGHWWHNPVNAMRSRAKLSSKQLWSHRFLRWTYSVYYRKSAGNELTHESEVSATMPSEISKSTQVI